MSNQSPSISIVSSSYILPDHAAWSSLGHYSAVSFYDYGDFHSALSNNATNSPLAIVLFYTDLIPDSVKSFEEGVARLSNLLSLIKNRLMASGAETIVCLSHCELLSPIEGARSKSLDSQLFDWFKSEIFECVVESRSGYLIDLAREFASLGYERIFDKRNWYLAHCHLSSDGISLLVDRIGTVSERIYKPAKKVLVLDCDNTLWGGVIGEDGLRGLKLGQDGLGQAFVDFQKEIKKLSEKGLLLAVASKNNEADVALVFESHDGMVLKKSDIVAWKVNWEQKSENIKQLAAELDLGIDSFVFWDDNPLERDLVKQEVPSVYTVDAPKQVILWPSLLASLSCFSNFTVTDEDRKKSDQYRSRAKFVAESKGAGNHQQYLKSIGLKPSATEINDSNIARAVQLCSKTNQFNLRTIRHKESDLELLARANPSLNFLVSLVDNYGDHGIIGLVCTRSISDTALFLDTYLMSCRVLGRHLESWMLDELTKRAGQLGYKYLVGEYIPSERNAMVSEFLTNHNFKSADGYPDVKRLSGLPPEIRDVSQALIFDIGNSEIPNVDIFQ